MPVKSKRRSKPKSARSPSGKALSDPAFRARRVTDKKREKSRRQGRQPVREDLDRD